MKKYILLFAAGSVLTLASCGGNETKTEDLQEHIDSSVNAKVEDMSAEMKAQNDSTINALAAAKADSIAKATEAAASKGKTVRKTVTTKTTITPKPVEPVPVKEEPKKTGGFGSKSDQGQTTQQKGGFGGKSDQGQTTQQKGGFGSKSDQK